MDETTPLIVKCTNSNVIYTRRWWILATFSYSCFLQTLLWNSWGPIAQSAKEVYNWTDGTIGLIPSCSNISCMCTVFLASYFMDERGTFLLLGILIGYLTTEIHNKTWYKRGLRISAVLCSGMIFMAAGLRCITSNPDYATWLMYISAIINGLAGTVFFAGPPLLASLWFPPYQRATATAISSMCIYAGLAGGFLIGPQLVDSPQYNITTNIIERDMVTVPSNVSTTSLYQQSQNTTVLANFSELHDQIMRLMYIECIAAGIGFFAILVYFPSKPPTPPSNSAQVKRTEYKKAIYQIVRHGPLWLISIAFALPIGVYAAWGAVLDVILHPVGVTQEDAGWIGFYATVGGCVAGVIVARSADYFLRHMKLFLVCLYICGGLSFTWFTLVCERIIPYSTAQLYIASIAGGVFLNCTIPLFYELSCETSYPISEGITGAFSTILDSLFGVSFLFILQIPNIGTQWMNWFLVGSIGVGILVLFVFRESYRRTDLDITIVVPNPKLSRSMENSDKASVEFIKEKIASQNEAKTIST